ncbi:MAG: hypothetical protein H0V54_07300 [Chthoniobacterales bacterium]|nr:hypothetical protein [Chthoniobacterales bacterium]
MTPEPHRVYRHPEARVWMLESPHCQIRRIFRTLDQAQAIARKEAPAGGTLLIFESEGMRRVDWQNQEGPQ